MVAEYADGWNTSGPFEDVQDALATLQRHCAEIGRDIATIEKTVSFPIILRDDAAAADTRIHELMAANGVPAADFGGYLADTPAAVADVLRPPPGSRLRDRDRPHAGTVRRRDHRADARGRGPSRQVNVVLLAGGVGGAKLAEGLAASAHRDLSVIVNTGDDLELHGLAVWPDHDTVAYTLAGLDDEVRGWGLRDETWTVMDRLEALGDRSGSASATGIWRRTSGAPIACGPAARPTEVALELGAAMGIESRILPMADEPVRTEVRTDDGWLEFQEYFVHRHQEPTVRRGPVPRRRVGPARRPRSWRRSPHADVIVVAPSNPIVSIGPILAVGRDPARAGGGTARGVPSWRSAGSSAARRSRARPTGCSPRSATSRARSASRADLRPLISHFVLDRSMPSWSRTIRGLGVETLVTDTIMTDDAARARLAEAVLRFATSPAGAPR